MSALTDPTDQLTLRVAQLIPDTEAEGPGRRFAVWLQGCPRSCPGCCNPEMRDPELGAPTTIAALVRQVEAVPGLEGLTLLGGEPFGQPAPAAALCRSVRRRGLSVMIFTGYTLGELQQHGPEAAALLAEADLLVDGPYRADRPEGHRRWVGSQNQRLRFLSSRYRPDDPRFAAPNTVEIRLRNGLLQVNGWPAGARRVLS